MRLIDADAFKAGLLGETGKSQKENGYTLLMKMFCALVDAEPTIVGAVRVVHCRDCIYFASGENDAEKWSWCKRHSHDAYPHEFCSWGAQKAGGTDA